MSATVTTPMSNTAGALQDVSNKNNSSTTTMKPSSSKPKTPPSSSGRLEVPRGLLDGFIKHGPAAGYGMIIRSSQAKKDYFLTPADLRLVPHDSLGGGVGVGAPMKIYKHEDLIQEALAKHGRAGLEKKLQARWKRQQTMLRKERQAAEAKCRVAAPPSHQTKPQPPQQNNANATAAAPSQVANPKQIKKLRASLLKLAKKRLGFERSGAPKKWRVEVPAVQAATFAALVGHPADTKLETFVKKGAYYTVTGFDTKTFFGVSQGEGGDDDDDDDENELEKYFSREGVAQRIGEFVTVRFKPSAEELSVSGWAEMAGW